MFFSPNIPEGFHCSIKKLVILDNFAGKWQYVTVSYIIKFIIFFWTVLLNLTRSNWAVEINMQNRRVHRLISCSLTSVTCFITLLICSKILRCDLQLGPSRSILGKWSPTTDYQHLLSQWNIFLLGNHFRVTMVSRSSNFKCIRGY